MSTRTLGLDDRLRDYLLAVSPEEAPVLARLREETAQHPLARMQIAPEQGHLLAFLIETLGASRVLEVGVFTGYSSTAMALALPPGGRIVACDVSEEYTAVARAAWSAAGVLDRVELRLAPAAETLRSLLAEGAGATFDFAFVDADKERYPEYLELALALLRPGGVLAFDNVLWSGRVADPTVTDAATAGIRALNDALARDPRVRIAVLP
ncbi:MAG: class I SAM-dependent methyltransferase, partial [Deltaproteobacteria bacterium]|nr:class I SAM-dependent methyltransferase [Deltaproteobacteria bacterium]